ncbi:protein TPX2 isoform X2 [Malania oleifera]|uniref:protein TPX2 isoform X2 n=1 Tax=Malania oleifera TaxID=397392 RepID=UPI0025AE2EFA|nr:protein TPX2 isoform X2 [Malania oleifera]
MPVLDTFVAKLVSREEIILENVNVSPKFKGVDSMDLINGDCPGLEGCEGLAGRIVTNLESGNVPKDQNQQQELPTELVFYDHIVKDNPKSKARAAVKPRFPRSSTLMKPTASYLAKQNPPCLASDSRFPTLSVNSNERILNNSSGIEIQAAKRQKLEGGHLRKVADTKQQIYLVHKTPKKDGNFDGNSVLAKMKLTIPREPDLETAHRAQRAKNGVEQERRIAHVFKARPLNRKILEAPSLLSPQKGTRRLPEFQAFHLRTSERAMQHTSAVLSSSFHCNNFDKGLHKANSSIASVQNGDRDTKRSNTVDAPKKDGCELTPRFRARPFNKKIFSSKGDIGVFRNSKRETTVPREFNFHTEKRSQPNPPTELFNKLSIQSELQPNTGSQLKVPRPTCKPMKGSKENRLGFLKQEIETTHLVKEKPSIFGGKQVQCSSNGRVAQIAAQIGVSRSMGIR